MQYNMLEGGGLEPLPTPSIDTGCGVERTTTLTEGVHSVYETDAFADIMNEIERWSGARYGADEQQTKALRVLADHGRAMTFLATDGIVPGREGREYVLRRVIRRAVEHGRRIGLTDPFLGRLHEHVVALLGEPDPDAWRPATRWAPCLPPRRPGSQDAEDRRQAAGRGACPVRRKHDLG